MLRFIDLRDANGRCSNLHYSDKKPGRLTVCGALPHGMEIEPASVEDAMRLREWLEAWIQRGHDHRDAGSFAAQRAAERECGCKP